MYFWSNKKIWIKNLSGVQNTREFGTSFCIFGELTTVFRQKCRQKRQFRSFSELPGDFWSKSFLLDQKNTVVYETNWFLIIARPYCSLLLIFRNFPRFFRSSRKAENDERWAVVSSNEQQWWKIIYFHKL